MQNPVFSTPDVSHTHGNCQHFDLYKTPGPRGSGGLAGYCPERAATLYDPRDLSHASVAIDRDASQCPNFRLKNT